MTKTTITRPASGLLRRLIRNTQGQDLIEYALLFAIVTMVCIVALNQVSVKVGNYFADTQTRIASGVGGGGAGAGGGAGDPGAGGGSGGGTGGGGTGGGGTGGGGTGGGGTGGGGTGGGGTGGGGTGGGGGRGGGRGN